MPESQLVLPQVKTIEPPNCRQCGGKMRLTSIEPHALGADLRTFKCDTCDHAGAALVVFG